MSASINIGGLKPRGFDFKKIIAKSYLKFIPAEKIIGIAGSIGKTTTMVCIDAILNERFKNVLTTSINSDDPLKDFTHTLLQIRSRNEKILLEIAPRILGEMEFYTKLVVPKTLIITKLLNEQHELNSNSEKLIEEFSNLIAKVNKINGTIILNGDDTLSKKLDSKFKGNVVYYGFNSSSSHVWASNPRILDFQTVFELNHGVERIEISTRLLGFHQIQSILAAAALGINMGYPLTSIKKAVEKVETLEHRLQPLVGQNSSVILDDIYSDAPYSYIEGLETLNHIAARKRIVIFGGIGRKGDQTEKMYRDIARKIFQDKIDMVFTVGGETGIIVDELNKLGFLSDKVKVDLPNQQIISMLLKNLTKGDVVLVKGADRLVLGEIMKRLAREKNNLW